MPFGGRFRSFIRPDQAVALSGKRGKAKRRAANKRARSARRAHR